MADNFTTVEVKGLRELERALLALDNTTGYKILRSALMQATTPMLKDAKRRASAVRDSGALAESLSRRSQRGTAKGQRDPNRAVTVFLGPNTRKKKALALWNQANKRRRKSKRLRHAHLVEFGGGTIDNAMPYLRPAAAANALLTVTRFAKLLRQKIEKALA